MVQHRGPRVATVESSWCTSFRTQVHPLEGLLAVRRLVAWVVGTLFHHPPTTTAVFKLGPIIHQASWLKTLSSFPPPSIYPLLHLFEISSPFLYTFSRQTLADVRTQSLTQPPPPRDPLCRNLTY
jgi:hypothetical protein